MRKPYLDNCLNPYLEFANFYVSSQNIDKQYSDKTDIERENMNMRYQSMIDVLK